MPADGAPDVRIDGGLWRLLRVDQNDRQREEHGNLPTWEHSSCTLSSLGHIDVQPTARNGARAV